MKNKSLFHSIHSELFHKIVEVKSESFRWNSWNLEHATKHGCTIPEIESVVRSGIRANRQRRAGNEKWIVIGRGQGNRVIQVVFVLDDDEAIYVIHAMPLTTRRRK